MFEQTFKNIDDVLWKEAGCSSELDYTEQSSWMLFLEYLDDLERERAMEAELVYRPCDYLMDKRFQWSNWAAPKKADGSFDHDSALTGDDLIDFVNRELFPYLQGFKQRASGPDTIEYKVGEIFGEIKSKFQSGYSLRDALAKLGSVTDIREVFIGFQRHLYAQQTVAKMCWNSTVWDTSKWKIHVQLQRKSHIKIYTNLCKRKYGCNLAVLLILSVN